MSERFVIALRTDCVVAGEHGESGSLYQVPDDLSESEARMLIRVGRAHKHDEMRDNGKKRQRNAS